MNSVSGSCTFSHESWLSIVHFQSRSLIFNQDRTLPVKIVYLNLGSHTFSQDRTIQVGSYTTRWDRRISVIFINFRSGSHIFNQNRILSVKIYTSGIVYFQLGSYTVFGSLHLSLVNSGLLIISLNSS